MGMRFLTLADVAEVLNISVAQARALVRSGQLRALKVGTHGQWRVEATELETYIDNAYRQTADYLASNPQDAEIFDEEASGPR